MSLRPIFQPGYNPALPGRSQQGRGAALAATAILTLSACAQENVANPGANSTDSAGAEVVEVLEGTLNFDGLTADNKCFGGGERPCFGILRTEPRLMPEGEYYMNNARNPGTYNDNNGNGEFDEGDRYTAVTWPYEASPEEPGDKLEVVCRVSGDEIRGAADPSIRSDVWDAVVVPANLSLSGEREVRYTPERWVDLPAGFIIEVCTRENNPAGAAVVTAPTQ